MKKKYCALWWLLFFVSITGLAAAIVVPWWQYKQDLAEQIDKKISYIERYQRLLKAKPEYEHLLKELNEKIAQEHYFIKARTASLGAAQLQKLINNLIKKTGGKLTSTQFLEQESKNNQIKLRVRMSGDVEDLFNLLYALEKQHPVIRIENLSINSRISYKGSGKHRVMQYSLDINFVLYAYLANRKNHLL